MCGLAPAAPGGAVTSGPPRRRRRGGHGADSCAPSGHGAHCCTSFMGEAGCKRCAAERLRRSTRHPARGAVGSASASPALFGGCIRSIPALRNEPSPRSGGARSASFRSSERAFARHGRGRREGPRPVLGTAAAENRNAMPLPGCTAGRCRSFCARAEKAAAISVARARSLRPRSVLGDPRSAGSRRTASPVRKHRQQGEAGSAPSGKLREGDGPLERIARPRVHIVTPVAPLAQGTWAPAPQSSQPSSRHRGAGVGAPPVRLPVFGERPARERTRPTEGRASNELDLVRGTGGATSLFSTCSARGR